MKRTRRDKSHIENKRKRAILMVEKWQKLSPQEQLNELDERRVIARKQRLRIEGIIAAQAE